MQQDFNMILGPLLGFLFTAGTLLFVAMNAHRTVATVPATAPEAAPETVTAASAPEAPPAAPAPETPAAGETREGT